MPKLKENKGNGASLRVVIDHWSRMVRAIWDIKLVRAVCEVSVVRVVWVVWVVWVVGVVRIFKMVTQSGSLKLLFLSKF